MWVKTFVTSLGIAALAVGCAGIDNLIAQGVGKATTPKKETDEQMTWRSAMEKKPGAENRPKVVDMATFATARDAVIGYVGQLDTYIRRNCKGTRASHCDEADRLVREAAKMQVDTYEQAMAEESIDFDHLQDIVMDLERTDATSSVNIDGWMATLSQRKLDYWTSELNKRGGGMAQYVEAKGQPICLPYNSEPKGNDTRGLAVSFTAKDKIWVKCTFTRPPSEFTRSDSDYWRVEILWSGRWEDVKMVYDIARPSTSQVAIFSFPADVVGERIGEKASATGFLYPGTWLRVRASYVTRSITGREWRYDKLVDVWKHELISGSSVYLKWK